MTTVLENGLAETAKEDDEFQVSTAERTPDGPSDVKDGRGFLERLRKDYGYRKRVLLTACVCWTFVTQGVAIGQLGPALPDLRLIINMDLQTAAWLITTMFFGYLIGSLVSGVLYDKYDRMVLLFLSEVGMAATTVVLPWCPYFGVMAAVRVLFGIFVGGVETGANAIVLAIWGTEGQPFMQALHFSFAFGGIISPLLTEPFLAPKTCEARPLINESIAVTTQQNGIATESSITKHATLEFYNTSFNGNNSTSSLGSCILAYRDTRIHYAYVITTVLLLSSACPFLYLSCKRSSKLGKKLQREEKTARKSKTRQMTFKVKIFLLATLSLLVLTYCAIEDNFSSFLMTFLLTQLDWSKLAGSLVTSVYWVAFAVGRFTGIFLTKCLTPAQMLGGFYVSFCLSFIGLLASAQANIAPLIWGFIAVTGFSSSVIYPALFSWADEKIISVNGKIAALFQISASVGSMSSSFLLGFLMETYTPMWYIYLILGFSVAGLILYFVVLVSVRNRVSFANQAESCDETLAVPESTALRRHSEELSNS